MTTGDKVLALLGAKAVCCGLLVLAATGALGGVGAWLTGGPGPWLLAGAFVLAIAAIILGRRGRDVPGTPKATARGMPGSGNAG
jgi:membrane protein implicated in regulation of membrane protease activity